MNSQAHCELTFLISNQLAEDVLDAAEPRLARDVCRQRIDDVYYSPLHQHSELDAKSCQKREYRVRQLDQHDEVSLDYRRCKKRGIVLRRTLVSRGSLQQLTSTEIDENWHGKWFHEQVLERRLTPRCHASFHRTEANWDTLEGPIRLTIDRNVRCRDAEVAGAPRPMAINGHALQACVMRMRYLVALPALFKQWIYDFALLPTRTSLFHQCVVALSERIRMPVDVERRVA